MGCGTTTVKVCSIVFNVILAFLGIAAIGWIAFNPDSLPAELAIGAYITGALIVLFSFLGCYAAIRESVCLTATCAIFLLILAVLQIALTCLDVSDRGLRSGIDTVNNAWEDSNEMDALQIKHECCGKISSQDYISLNKPIPASCYTNQNATDEEALFTVGCTTVLQEYYDHESTHFAIVSWVLIAFELLGFLLAVFLVINFRNTQRRMQF